MRVCVRVRSSFVSARGVVRSEARLEVLTTSGSVVSESAAIFLVNRDV
jgi:hypothetical protein